MRLSRSLLAQLTSASARTPERFLTPGQPTGLTGLLTHPFPRSTLIYLYQSTLKSLATIPASSAYKTATTNLTNHRLKIVEAVQPAGYVEWRAKAQAVLDENKDAVGTEVFKYGEYAPEAFEARRFAQTGLKKDRGPYSRQDQWDGRAVGDAIESMRSEEERAALEAKQAAEEARMGFEGKGVDWTDSPALESSQISELEEKLGAGLIEEIIQVAEGELRLADKMIESKAWEELEDKAPEGQWEYFGRNTHMPMQSTQKPPS